MILGTFLEISLQEFKIGKFDYFKILQKCCQKVYGAYSIIGGRRSQPELVLARWSPIPYGLRLPTLKIHWELNIASKGTLGLIGVKAERAGVCSLANIGVFFFQCELTKLLSITVRKARLLLTSNTSTLLTIKIIKIKHRIVFIYLYENNHKNKIIKKQTKISWKQAQKREQKQNPTFKCVSFNLESVQ